MRKKHFLILVLFLVFFAPCLQAQHNVVIPDSVASWFLERNTQLTLLEKDVVILREEIENLKYQVSIDTEIKQTYVNDSKDYIGKLQVKEEQLKDKEKQIRDLTREIRTQKLLKWLGWSVAVLLVIANFLLHG